MNKIQIYQIYYDDLTRNQVEKEFLELDNTSNHRSDWYEFWPILNFLRKNKIENDTWYGFLSTKFKAKTGVSAKFLTQIIKDHGDRADVIIISPGWDQLAYFKNTFEQAEYWHSGIQELTSLFLEKIKLKINLMEFITDSSNSGFSNYIIAKGKYWQNWLNLSEQFFYIADNNEQFNKNTTYGSENEIVPMKVFIQERLSSIILNLEDYKIITYDQSTSMPIFEKMFENNIETRKLLITCDLMKKYYRMSNNNKYLDMYWEVRNKIKLKK